MAPKPSRRRRSSHSGITEQHGFKVLRITADMHLLEVIVRSTAISVGRVHAIGNDVDAGGLQTFDRFDYFLREIGSLAFRALGPGGTVVIELDKDLLHT